MAVARNGMPKTLYRVTGRGRGGGAGESVLWRSLTLDHFQPKLNAKPVSQASSDFATVLVFPQSYWHFGKVSVSHFSLWSDNVDSCLIILATSDLTWSICDILQCRRVYCGERRVPAGTRVPVSYIHWRRLHSYSLGSTTQDYPRYVSLSSINQSINHFFINTWQNAYADLGIHNYNIEKFCRHWPLKVQLILEAINKTPPIEGMSALRGYFVCLSVRSAVRPPHSSNSHKQLIVLFWNFWPLNYSYTVKDKLSEISV